ncbi:MAG: hypothetical protein E7388_01560 [Ruminococcaceae bacterium]|nr:hypothetical protein [Oscillospiraceae bacterium]
MRKFYTWVVNNPKKILITFVLLALIGAVLQSFVKVNYDMTKYLPDETSSTVSIEIMKEEFTGGIPNARLMVKNTTIAEALEFKEKIKACQGVVSVLWLDDSVNVYQPLEMLDQKTVETYYKENNALFTVTIDEDDLVSTVERLRDIIGEENAMSGDAVSTSMATTGSEKEIKIITVLSILIVLIILLITTTSWAEPFVVLLGIGVAVVINNGSNILFDEVSFVTNASGSILQLAVSLDYSVFLIHRYTECLKLNPDRKEALIDALCKSTSSIASSGLTTVIGFLALVFMRFGIGSNLGIALAKGVGISLINIFVFMPAFILFVYPLIEKTTHRKFMPEFRFFGRLITKVMIPVALVFILIAVPSFAASNSNSFYYGSAHIYGEETDYGIDTKAIEDVFGKSDTYVVIVPNGDVDSEIELSQSLHEIPQVKNILSYVDTVGAEIPKEYLDEGTLSQLVSDNYNRFVLTVDAEFEGKETFALVENIRNTVNRYYPDSYYLAGEGVSTYDLMDTITKDNLIVNIIAIVAVFVILLITTKSLIIPIVLVFAIEAAIWVNIGIPYFTDSSVHYLAYLIISSIQLGATVDYAILFADRYIEKRKEMYKKEAIRSTVSAVTTSILTSGIAMAVVGFALSILSTHGILSQFGLFLGRGTLLSMISVFFVLPGLLYIFDGLIQKGTYRLDLYNPEKENN